MKNIFLLLLATSTFSAFAGDVMNTKTGERLIAECDQVSIEGNCVKYKIIHRNESSENHLANFVVREISNPEDQFLLREKIKKFKAMPISDVMYNNDKVAMTTGGVTLT